MKLAQGPAIPVPTIVSFDPPEGSTGTTVTITGTNFDPVPSNNTVLFNGTAASISSSTSTTIIATVPPGASDGQISVSVNCATATSITDFIIEENIANLVIYNAVSPTNDSKNEFFRIENIESLGSNHVTIYNRWGDVVFEVSNYNNNDRVFTGISNSGKELPSGIYYYKLKFTSSSKTGFLSLKR
ncbi:MAG: gliding motility-associated C-terminal domain-containing protein [Cyclobacteriaceae bacterium]|nr:MAG: gliding motility-associated C-terminal domain-containing protein [Cyclobacteriaceae bacterium]